MKRTLFVLAAIFAIAGCAQKEINTNDDVSSRDYAASKYEKIEKCVKRIRDACYLSNNDEGRIEDNIQECKHVDSSFTTYWGTKYEVAGEVLLLRDAGKVVFVNTKSKYGNHCQQIKYNVGSNIDDVLVIGDRVYMRGTNGSLYFMDMNASGEAMFYQLLNSKKKAYTTISKIRGYSPTEDTGADMTRNFVNNSEKSNTAVAEFGNPNQKMYFDPSRMRDKIQSKEASHIEFRVTQTNRSLFRDE